MRLCEIIMLIMMLVCKYMSGKGSHVFLFINPLHDDDNGNNSDDNDDNDYSDGNDDNDDNIVV